MTANSNSAQLSDRIIMRDAKWFADEVRHGRGLSFAADLIEKQSSRIDDLTIRLNKSEFIAARLKGWLALAALGIMFAILAACAAPIPIPAAQMQTGAQAMPPMGYIAMCAETDCAPIPVTAPTKLNSAKWTELNAINDAVNRLPKIPDTALDVWQPAATRGGDCEDLALEKQQRLIAAGWPSGDLLLATARTFSGEGHAVLIVRTDRGDLVLDDINWAIVTMQDAPYVWRSMQAPGFMKWAAIK